jgi:type IV secretion system protein VirD4
VSADFYIQSFAGLERQYGREAAAAIESYSDIRIYAGLNSLARAKHVSDMLAEETIRKQDASYQASVERIGLASREMGRPLMKPDEVLSMERDQGWLFVRGLRPTRLHLINYAEVAPWCDWVGNSPITGTRLRAARPRLTIDYPNLTRPACTVIN